MGYVRTPVSWFIDPAQIAKTAGTWTPTVSSNATFHRRTAADAAFTLIVPVSVLTCLNATYEKGFELGSVELLYKIATEAADDFATLAIQKNSYAADGTQAGSQPTQAIDTSHDTAAERKTLAVHRAKVTLGSLATPVPVYIDNDENYALQAVVDMGANGVFDLYGAIVNGILRL